MYLYINNGRRHTEPSVGLPFVAFMLDPSHTVTRIRPHALNCACSISRDKHILHDLKSCLGLGLYNRRIFDDKL